MQLLNLFSFFFFFLVAFLSVPTDSIKCHKCGGQENMSKLTKKLFTELNISPDKYYGNCKAKEGADVCTDGSFCIKRAKVHRIGFNSFNFKWTSYTKGCASQREDNNQTASNGCFDLNLDTKSTGYTTKRLDCYCDKDFCNSSSHLLSLATVAFLATWMLGRA